jgi:hypothetical protein
MINATLEDPDDRSVDRIVREGPAGAVALAGVATAIVLLIWLGFYLFVFSPRVVP